MNRSNSKRVPPYHTDADLETMVELFPAKTKEKFLKHGVLTELGVDYSWFVYDLTNYLHFHEFSQGKSIDRVEYDSVLCCYFRLLEELNHFDKGMPIPLFSQKVSLNNQRYFKLPISDRENELRQHFKWLSSNQDRITYLNTLLTGKEEKPKAQKPQDTELFRVRCIQQIAPDFDPKVFGSEGMESLSEFGNMLLDDLSHDSMEKMGKDFSQSLILSEPGSVMGWSNSSFIDYDCYADVITMIRGNRHLSENPYNRLEPKLTVDAISKYTSLPGPSVPILMYYYGLEQYVKFPSRMQVRRNEKVLSKTLISNEGMRKLFNGCLTVRKSMCCHINKRAYGQVKRALKRLNHVNDKAYMDYYHNNFSKAKDNCIKQIMHKYSYWELLEVDPYCFESPVELRKAIRLLDGIYEHEGSNEIGELTRYEGEEPSVTPEEMEPETELETTAQLPTWSNEEPAVSDPESTTSDPVPSQQERFAGIEVDYGSSRELTEEEVISRLFGI